MEKNTMILNCEEHYKPGRIVLIREQPRFAKKSGDFLKGSKHIIQKPPEKYLNSPMGVWLKNKNGKLKYLQFPYFQTTPQIAPQTTIKRTRGKFAI